jgi:hypothetical protein
MATGDGDRESSSGWRRISRTLRGNSGNSSRNSSPLCARLTSPGRGMPAPPPIMPASEIVWCGARKGRVRSSPPPGGSAPAMLWIFVVSIASSKRHRRKNAGQPLRQHRLARSRRPDHEHVVLSRRRHQQARVWPSSARARRGNPAAVASRASAGVRPDLTGAKSSGLASIATTSARCFTPNTLTPSTTAASAAFSSGRIRFSMPFSRAQTAIERAPRTGRIAPSSDSSPHGKMLVEALECAHRAENRERHRQIEARAFLAHVRRRQVHRDRLAWIAETGIHQGGLDPLPALAHRRIRHADQHEIARHPAAEQDRLRRRRDGRRFRRLRRFSF